MLTGCVPIAVLYRFDPPDDEQQACSKHVEAYYLNKLMEYGASLLVHIVRIYHDARSTKH